MISATDSFIQYLSTELNGIVPVAWNHATPTDASSSEMQMNTLNVSALSFRGVGTYEDILVSLDLIGEDERLTYDWAKSIRTTLISVQYTPELDYEANPVSPVPSGHMVSWYGREIDFQVVQSALRYIHLNATFLISHVR